MNELIERGLTQFRRILYHGQLHVCPICASHVRRFKPMGERKSARCPVCGSFERHRLIWLHCRANTNLFDGRSKRMLHVAAERCLANELKRLPGLEYIRSEYAPGDTTVRLDVTALPFADKCFDVIFCNHVLEHIPDDKRAMAELHRVLKPGGWAIMQVPIKGERTLEDSSIASPAARALQYGQADHVRQYGLDYADRLRETGFTVERNNLAAELPSEDRQRFGLLPDEDLYLCTRTA